jgi:hypothetical protein
LRAASGIELDYNGLAKLATISLNGTIMSAARAGELGRRMAERPVRERPG